MSNNKETFQRGDFQFEKGTGNVIFVPNENGAWNVQAMPEKPAPEGKCETCGISLKPGARFCGDHWRDYPGKGEGWEIEAYNYAGNIYEKNGGYFYNQKWIDAMTESQMTGLGCKIHSVKRLSDGEVFSVKDDVSAREGEYCHWDRWYKIISMSVKNGTLGIELMNVIETNPTGSIWREIQNIKRIPAPKQPLFTTSDGKDVYEGDTVWGVAIQASGTDMIRPRTMPFEKHVNRQSRRWFSTESAANEYVKWHKPGFSLYEIVNNSEMKGLSDETKGDVLYQFRLPKLIEIAKSKIDKP